MRLVIPNHYKRVGILVGQRPQQNGIDHAEDGAVCADAEGERDNDDDRKGRTAREHAQAVTQILNQIAEQVCFSFGARNQCMFCRGFDAMKFSREQIGFVQFEKRDLICVRFGRAATELMFVFLLEVLR